MAKIIIEINDMPDNKVSVTSNPSGAEIAGYEMKGSGLTPAHDYALGLLYKARALGKAAEKGEAKSNLIITPEGNY